MRRTRGLGGGVKNNGRTRGGRGIDRLRMGVREYYHSGRREKEEREKGSRGPKGMREKEVV